ncbi:MAG: biotin--[acetyl-CoA-carboxylase] ligase [Erysipelotrichaceae bacterium]|nr:biotin--[acetyl-CoA-carboxylase] ligase [Erysipelotrichaceae bacterium]
MNKIHFKEIDSTNTWLKENYRTLEDMTSVSARLQTAGRGRRGRSWESQEGNLYLSLLLKDEKYLRHVDAISTVSAYLILKVLEGYGIKDLGIKWPNDIYVKDEKICGILLESVSTDRLECLIIGIGLNVNQKEFSGDYRQKPVSMRMLTGRDTDLDQLEDDVCKALTEGLNQLNKGHDFHAQISRYDYLRDKDVYALIEDKKEAVHVLGNRPGYTLEVICKDLRKNLRSSEISFHL